MGQLGRDAALLGRLHGRLELAEQRIGGRYRLRCHRAVSKPPGAHRAAGHGAALGLGHRLSSHRFQLLELLLHRARHGRPLDGLLERAEHGPGVLRQGILESDQLALRPGDGLGELDATEAARLGVHALRRESADLAAAARLARSADGDRCTVKPNGGGGHPLEEGVRALDAEADVHVALGVAAERGAARLLLLFPLLLPA